MLGYDAYYLSHDLLASEYIWCQNISLSSQVNRVGFDSESKVIIQSNDLFMEILARCPIICLWYIATWYISPGVRRNALV